MDENALEMAEAHAEQVVANRIRAISMAVDKKLDPDFDGKHCVDCLSEIDPRRLAIFKDRCVHCQAIIEKRDKMFRRG